METLHDMIYQAQHNYPPDMISTIVARAKSDHDALMAWLRGNVPKPPEADTAEVNVRSHAASRRVVARVIQDEFLWRRLDLTHREGYGRGEFATSGPYAGTSPVPDLCDLLAAMTYPTVRAVAESLGETALAVHAVGDDEIDALLDAAAKYAITVVLVRARDAGVPDAFVGGSGSVGVVRWRGWLDAWDGHADRHHQPFRDAPPEFRDAWIAGSEANRHGGQCLAGRTPSCKV